MKQHYRSRFAVTVVENGYIVDIDASNYELSEHICKNGFEIFICKTEEELAEHITTLAKKAREFHIKTMNETKDQR